ncbi:MAG: hypothetical protein EXR29_15270 [Betaproteobacteria bacterium]|nr:hypothetical protein [Betaproteobacteria bacterium]
MTSVIQGVLNYTSAMPEGRPLAAKELLHLGSRAAVDQALSRLVRRGVLLRAGRGVYMIPVESRFGKRAPMTAKVVEELAARRGETIVPHGAAIANALGLTTQVPAREVYLTSGRTRQLKLGSLLVEFRHAPAWQLTLPGRNAGNVVRALAWMGPGKTAEAIQKLKYKLPKNDLEEIASTRARLPTWMAKEVSELVRHA